MSQWIYSITVAAAVCAVCGCLIPEGRMKKASGLVFSAVMLTAILSPITDIDFKTYSISSEKYKQQADEIISDGEKMKENLDRRYIEDEYSAYILDKAASTGLAVQSAKVNCTWSTEGCWYPDSAEIVLSNAETEEKINTLKRTIEAELGIEASRQTWRTS